MKTWTDYEVGRLVEMAPLGMKAVLSAIPAKTPQSIFSKASKMGVTIERKMEYDRNADEMTNKIWIWNNRILPVLQKKGECLEWNGANSKGYGQIRFFVNGVKKIFLTHAIAVEVREGKLMDAGFGCMHKCDNPACCNPDHLSSGTQSDNMRDCQSKGRTRGIFKKGQAPTFIARGMDSKNSKMTDDSVREARRIYDSNEMGYKRLAKRFGVATRTMWKIVHRIGWKHIT